MMNVTRAFLQVEAGRTVCKWLPSFDNCVTRDNPLKKSSPSHQVFAISFMEECEFV